MKVQGHHFLTSELFLKMRLYDKLYTSDVKNASLLSENNFKSLGNQICLISLLESQEVLASEL